MSTPTVAPSVGDRILIEGAEYVVNRVTVQDKKNTHYVGRGEPLTRPIRAQIDLMPVAEIERRRDSLMNLLDGIDAGVEV